MSRHEQHWWGCCLCGTVEPSKDHQASQTIARRQYIEQQHVWLSLTDQVCNIGGKVRCDNFRALVLEEGLKEFKGRRVIINHQHSEGHDVLQSQKGVRVHLTGQRPDVLLVCSLLLL